MVGINTQPGLVVLMEKREFVRHAWWELTHSQDWLLLMEKREVIADFKKEYPQPGLVVIDGKERGDWQIQKSK